MKTITDGSFMSTDRTIGIMQIEKPHNEKPVGRFDLKKLKDMIYTAEKLGHEEAWVWYARGKYGGFDSEAGLVVITPEKDANVGIGVAGRTEGKK